MSTAVLEGDLARRPVSALRASKEMLSPFIAWQPEVDAATLEPLLDSQPPSLVRELLVSPAAVVTRLLEAGQVAPLMKQCLLLLVTSSGFSAGLIAMARRAEVPWAMVMTPVSLLVALVAAIGPIAAVSLVLGVRMPWSRLSATLVAALSAGALVSSALAPAVLVLQRWNDEWGGGLGIIGVYVVAGLVTGMQAQRLMLALAGPQLAEELTERIEMFGRIATMALGLTVSLSIWSFHAFG
ncbi:MAG: hypothetical protein JNG84_13505 [Archangium sp.]|nr:hypothetical protein [Archangium sp.]